MAGSAAGTATVVCPVGRAAQVRPETTTTAGDIAEARRRAEAELRQRLEALQSGPARQILHAHISLLSDPTLTTTIAHHLERGLSADDALEVAAQTLAARFEALHDPLLRARGADLRDVCAYIVRHLRGERLADSNAAPRVICAADLSPAQVLCLAEGGPLAFVLEHGAETSHAAILMRALAVPAIIGVRGAMASIREGDRVLVDADRAQVIVNPDASVALAVQGRIAVRSECDEQPARTREGVAIAVTATIAGPADARRAITAGADGIGLFRTEWLFLRDKLPSESEQFEAYRDVATIAQHRPVTVRAVDLGGDKLPRALCLAPERNPALGLRGVRLAFAYPDLLQTQVRALIRAFAGRRVRLMLPMVTDPGDIARARTLLESAADSSIADRFELGALIETPAAALMVEEIASVVDFLSIGTNDLTQYVLAADREISGPTSPYEPWHPAVLRLLRHTAAAARRSGKPLSICGETGRDPLLSPILIGLGVTELSVPPDAIAQTKQLVRRVSIETARELGEALMVLPTAAAVRARIVEASAVDVQQTGETR